MWPWEHLAVAYVLYSLSVNAVRRAPPTGLETVAVAVGSQLPDLVDKPLAWTAGVVETGYAVAHSVFVAPAVCLAAFLLAARVDERSLSGAFSIAYCSHLAADVFYPLFLGRGLEPRAVLWPIASPPPDAHGGLSDHVLAYLARYVGQLAAEGASAYVRFQLGLGVLVLVLWLADGAPVAADCWRWLADRAER